MNKKQFRFSILLAILIIYIYLCGYTVAIGDVWAEKGEGRKHSDKSKHYDKQAADLNLFKDGVYLSETQDHKKFGSFWKILGGTWGGDWDDGNHYQI